MIIQNNPYAIDEKETTRMTRGLIATLAAKKKGKEKNKKKSKNKTSILPPDPAPSHTHNHTIPLVFPHTHTHAHTRTHATQSPRSSSKPAPPKTMSFVIDIGSDLYGTKVNTQLTFPTRPTVVEVTAAVESEFDVKGRAVRPAGYPDVPFKVETFQLFDETLLRWVDLYNEQQLKSGAQLWCFQPESIWHSDAQGVIPQPEKVPVTWTTPLGSPRRARIAADAGVPPTLSEKLRSVFYQIDGTNKGYLLRQDLEAAFRSCEMQFNSGTAGDLFTLADQNRSQHVTYDEWVNFAIKCPSIVDALFFRMRDMGSGNASFSPPPADAQHARQTELRNMYHTTWNTPSDRADREREFAEAREQEAGKLKGDAERALVEHNAALESAQRAAQEHAQQHAAARQAASQQSAAMDSAQQALAAADQARRQAADQAAAARAAEEQANAARSAAERLLAQAQAGRSQAEAAADTEAAAQYAAEQHAAQQQEAKRQAAAALEAAARELSDASNAQNAARAAAQAAQEAAQAQASAQAAQAQAQAAKDAAAFEQQQLSSMRFVPPPQPVAPPPPQPQQVQLQHGSPMPPLSPGGGDDARRAYEAAKRRADDLRRSKEDVCAFFLFLLVFFLGFLLPSWPPTHNTHTQAERAEREAWNKLYYSPSSPHFGNSP